MQSIRSFTLIYVDFDIDVEVLTFILILTYSFYRFFDFHVLLL